tara:strand:- start:735 stop:2111 length:1377 start_codon:yes stop_codon:yes gene_type:complete
VFKCIILKILYHYKKTIFKVSVPKSLDMACQYVGVIYKYQIPIYNVIEIENFLFRSIRKKVALSEISSIDKDGILFVISEPYITGGHTRLMEVLSLMWPGKKEVLITRNCEGKAKERLGVYFDNISVCVRGSTEDSISYVLRLFEHIKSFKKVILNIHPDDIYLVLSCALIKQLNKDVTIYFVNHADHVVTFGASIADFWFEISLYGRELDKNRGIFGVKSFLGIPINKDDENFFNKMQYPNIEKVKKFVTAGSAGKYKPFRGNSISPLIKAILRLNKNFTFIIIGPTLRNWWLFFLNRKFKGRIFIFNSLAHDEYIDLTQEGDYYVDSSPMPGGTAFVEQFMGGKPCIGLKTGFYGYTPLEKMKFEQIDDVISLLKKPPTHQDLSILQSEIYDVHSFTEVERRFQACIIDGVVSDNPMLSYSDDLVTNIEIPRRYGRLLLSKSFFIFKALFSIAFNK